MASNEIMRALSHEVEQNDRYNKSPSFFSPVGQEDRRHEAEHQLAIRDADRKGREVIANEAVRAVSGIARVQGDSTIASSIIECRSRELDEAKLALQRAKTMSRAVSENDPELAAECGALDIEFFSGVRALLKRPAPQPDGGLFG